MGTSKLLTPAYEFSPRILICLPLPKQSFIKKKKKNLSSKTHNKYVFMTQVKDNPLRQRGSSRDDDGQQRRLTRHHVSNLRPIASRGGGEETYKKKIKKDNAGAALRSVGKHTKCAPTGGGGILAASPLLIVCHPSEIKSNSFVFRMPDTFLRDIFFFLRLSPFFLALPHSHFTILLFSRSFGQRLEKIL